MKLQEIYLEYHPLLFSIAYQMLGTITEAEDIVQDVYLKLSEKNMDYVENVKAYLCRMVTNRSIDYLKSAQKKRELYIGPWLPEPLIEDNEPYSNVIKGEIVSFAILVLLEKLKPIERAVFILREVMEYDYSTIAEIVGKSELNCRKIFSRVKEKFPVEVGHDISIEENHEQIIRNFVTAIYEENHEKLQTLLANDVTLYSDGGGKVYAAIKPIHTKDFVLRFVNHIVLEFLRTQQVEPAIKFVNINGQIGILTADQNNLKTVISFQVKQNQITNIFIVRNPDKLFHIK